MIANGTRFGPYEITAQLGAGGMGEVYRARDQRLDRTVAIKVMPPSLSADARFRERFEREARAISSLTHPHICTLYDVGTQDGVDYLVMEYLEGESLAERLAKGPLPMDQAIRYGVQIAEALDRAHRAGIVHRDLKPGNVILTKGGAKLLDFGLAKFSSRPASDPNAATAAMSHLRPLTEEGTVVGTFQYMAPEQIEGGEADARTDLFALGVLLYEMATGRRAFEAKTRASLIASILDREPPPISTIQPLTPPAFERVVKMCLAKDPDERWQSAHDVAAELRWIGASSSETIGPAARQRSRRALLRMVTLILAGLAIGALAATSFLRGKPRESPQVARFAIRAEPFPLLLASNAIAISPDGTSIVYRGLEGDHSRLYLRTLDNRKATVIPGTENAYNITFSPDGRWLAFYAREEVYKIPREGGTRVKLTESFGGGLGLTWAGDTIYATRVFAGGVWAIPSSGGKPRLIAKPDPAKRQRAIVWPDILPGGKTLLMTVWNQGTWNEASITAFSIADGSSRVVLQGGHFARYSPTGHLLFLRGGNLMAVPFDAETLTAGATATTVVTGVAHGTADGEALYAISRAGHLIYAQGGDSEPLSQLVWIDAAGRKSPIVPTQRHYGSIGLAPDGRSALVTQESSTYDIWSLDLERDSVTRVSHGGDDSDGIITPDGTRAIWASSRSGVYNLYMRPLDGSGPEERLLPSEHDQEDAAISPDGTQVVYMQRGKSLDLWSLSLATRSARPILATPFQEANPSISPDGRWLAFASDESGERQVYVTTFPTPSGKWQVSIDGGDVPKWMPTSKEIVYQLGEKLFVVPFETIPRPRAGKPRLLFQGDFHESYSIAPDGRIAMILGEGAKTAAEVHLILNFSEELKRKLPVR